MNLIIVVCAFLFSWSINAIKDRYSQTFLFTRPAYQRLTAYEAFWHNMVYYHDCEGATIMQAIAYWQQSNNEDTKLDQYFLMKGKNELTVKGDTVTKTNRDIRAEWLFLPSTFNGEFSLLPEQKQFGCLFEMRKDIKKAIDWDIFDNFWVGAFIPFVSVKNELNLAQSYRQAATTYPHTVLEALANREFIYNKMLNCSSNMGLTEIRLMVGARFATANTLQIATRSAVSLPLGKPAEACQFFPATRGFNGHLGFEQALDTQFQVNCSDSCKVLFFADFSTLYLFAKTENRTFDLVDKPYSRYLLLNKITGERNIPGINILTPRVKVKPHNIFELATGFRVQRGHLEAQLAYNLWGKGTDKIELRHEWDNSYGIAAADEYSLSDGTPATASRSTISQQAAPDRNADGDLIFIAIDERDLDFKSAADRGTLTSSIDGAVGWVHDGEKVQGFIGAGGFIELPMNNAALKQWGIWFKIGASV